jgi:hypothetical protein
MQALKTLCARLVAIARGEDSAPPVITLDTKWGRHILRAYWLNDDYQSAEALIGVRIQRQEPMILRFVQAMGRLPLSPQQREIALMIAQGKSNQEIAEGLGVSAPFYHISSSSASMSTTAPARSPNSTGDLACAASWKRLISEPRVKKVLKK